jgi:hypothetical protein
MNAFMSSAFCYTQWFQGAMRCVCALAILFLSPHAVGQTTSCAAGQAPQNAYSLQLSTASYFGLGTTDAAYATEFAPDCTLLVGGRTTIANGTFSDLPSVGDPLASIASATTGSVARLSADGTQLLARSRFGAQVNDLAVSQTTGDIAVASDVALAVVAADLRTVRWAVNGNAARVAMTTDGRVAALFGKTLRVYDAAGTERFFNTFGDAQVSDVAFDAASGLVFVTGFAQRDGGGCSQLQVAWIRAYDGASGTLRWRAYDYPQNVADQHSDCADTRGRLVAMGGDGKLYFGGTSAGGNAIFRWDAQARLTAAALYPATAVWPSAPNVKPGNDFHVDAYNTRSNHITYMARFDPANGRQEAGFFLLTRLSSTLGNTIEPRAIAADEHGRVFVGGFAASAIANRSQTALNGTPLAAYAGSDAWLLVTSLDYAARDTWVAFNNGGQGTVFAIAASRGAVAIGAQVAVAPLFATANALQATSPSTGVRSGYFATFGLPASTPPCWFDVDANGSISATRDALPLMRSMLTLPSSQWLTASGIASANAHGARTRALLARSTHALDVDGNGVVEPHTDGVLLLRALYGFNDTSLIAGALGVPSASGGWRNSASAIRSYLQTQCVTLP